jgi:hypothetical protein
MLKSKKTAQLHRVLAIAIMLLLAFGGMTVAEPIALTPVINEFSCSTTGTDIEYIELYGVPDTNYDTLTILEIEGDGDGAGVIDEVVEVGSTNSQGLWLGNLPANALENGTITLLLVEGFTGALNQDLDTDNDGVLESTPWETILDSVAINDGGADDITYSVPVLTVSYDGLAYAPGGASRIPDGYDMDLATDWIRNDFDLFGIPGYDGTPILGEAVNTPGSLNQTVAEPIAPVINEFSCSTVGTDVEYVELYGLPETNYGNLTILEIEGDTTGAGVIDEVVPVGSTNSEGLWYANLPVNALENGTLTLLLVEGFTGSLGQDLDTDNDGIPDITPWTTVLDSVAVNDGGAGDITYSEPVLTVSYDGMAYAPGGASRIPDGYDTDLANDWVRNDFDLFGIPEYAGTPVLGEAVNTPGSLNEVVTETLPESVFIHEVQGSGAVSPLDGKTVIIEGVVVGDFQHGASGTHGDLDGFYVQEEEDDADADPLTSEGIFIYDGSSPAVDVMVGDLVSVTGAVSEYSGLTEITSFAGVTVVSSGNALPAATSLSLPVTAVSDLESFEGMRVTFPQALVIAEYFNFDRYGEIVLTSERHLTPTAEFEPGSVEVSQAAAKYLLDSITLDDGRDSQNPDPAIHPNGEIFDLDNLFRGGDTVQNVTGIMDYDFGLYRIQPTQGADYSAANPRPDQPDDTGGNVKVASFNVLNYFITFGERGADNEEEFERQKDKIVAALAAIDADVVGLIEIENSSNDEATADLVSGLNDFLDEDIYSYIATGEIGTDEIRVAMIYKQAAVSPVGDYAILNSSVDSRFIDTSNRPTLAQTFMDDATGGIFTVAVNHLKSKGSACPDDPDIGDGAGNCNLTRTAAAEALVDWLATDPTGSGDADFLIIGDLNSYDKEDPIDAILRGADDIPGTGDDYTDMAYAFLGEDAYSYVFDGQNGYLDYALASAGLVDEITGMTYWHINADEPDLIDYDTTYKQDAQDLIYAPDQYRSSDHDPVIVGLSVCDEIAPSFDSITITPDVLWPPNHKYVDIEATVTASDNLDTNPVIALISVTSNEPDNAEGPDDGNTKDDIIIVDDYHFQLRAERSDTGTGRIYTITYEVTDACGNSTIQSATVTVPLQLGD